MAQAARSQGRHATRPRGARRSVGVALASAIVLFGIAAVSARADLVAVKGSAIGYTCDVKALGFSCSPPASTATVTLAADASNSPQTASAPSARAESGPATVFSSGRIDVSSSATLGPTGSQSSATHIANVNASDQENFTAASLASTCTATATGVGGSTTIAGGTLMTDNGDDDPSNSIPDHPPVVETLPANPAPNTTYTGHLHIGSTTDNFRWVFNEQTINADGSLTVRAAHEYVLGPVALGDLIVGRAVCGGTAGAAAGTGPGGGTAPPPPAVVDRTPPKATLSGAKYQKVGTSVRVGVLCPVEACRATVRGTLTVPVAGKRFGRLYKLKPSVAAISKGGRATLRPRLSKLTLRAVRHALCRHRWITVRLTVTVADAANNTKTLKRLVRLKR